MLKNSKSPLGGKSWRCDGPKMKVVPSKGMEDFLKLLILNCSLMLKNTNCYNLLIIHLIRYRPTLRPDYKSSKIITNKSNYKGDVRLVISIYAMYLI